jgi:hypothetical protein
MQEIFKDVVGYEGLYQVSNLGNVRSLRYHKFKLLNLRKSIYGYTLVDLYSNKIKRTFNVHRLVAITFIDNPNNKREVNHINGIKHDNRLENLEWNTREENREHAKKTGLINNKGVNNHQCKLKEYDIIKIKNDNRPQSKIAKDFNISQTQVSRIKTNKRWCSLN